MLLSLTWSSYYPHHPHPDHAALQGTHLSVLNSVGTNIRVRSSQVGTAVAEKSLELRRLLHGRQDREEVLVVPAPGDDPVG